jgi:hypothetical protein
MDLSKLRTGELVAAIGGIVLLFSLLFLNWYGVGGTVDTPFGSFSVGGDFGAWDHQGFFGTIANLLILAAALTAIMLAVITATSRTIALPVASSAVTAGLGITAVVMVLARMLLQPGPNGSVDLKFGIYLALIGSVAIAWGGWRAMRDEGTSFAIARDRMQTSVRDDGAAARRREPPPPRREQPPAGDVPPQSERAEPDPYGEPPASSPPPGP